MHRRRKRAASHRPPWRRLTSASMVPDRPCGMNTTSSTSTAPMTKRQYWVIDITKSCSNTNASAPIAGPANVPLPPRTAMNTRLPEWVPAPKCGTERPVATAKNVPPVAAKNRRDHERRQPHPENLHADIGGLAGVLADSAQMQAERRLGNAPHRQTQQRKQ